MDRSPSKGRAGLRLLEGPVQITLDGFARSFDAIKSHTFVGRPVADTLLPREDTDETEEDLELMQGAQEQIKSRSTSASAGPDASAQR